MPLWKQTNDETLKVGDSFEHFSIVEVKKMVPFSVKFRNHQLKQLTSSQNFLDNKERMIKSGMATEEDYQPLPEFEKTFLRLKKLSNQ